MLAAVSFIQLFWLMMEKHLHGVLINLDSVVQVLNKCFINLNR